MLYLNSKLFTFIFLILSLSLISGCGLKAPAKEDNSTAEVKVLTETELDDLPVISFSVGLTKFDAENNKVTVSELSGGVVVVATLSKKVNKEINFGFSYDIINSTADNLSDFLIQTPDARNGQPTGTSGSAFFAPNTTSASFVINIINDSFSEEDETLSISIGNNPDGDIQSTVALPLDRLGRKQILITIEDDEGIPEAVIESVKIGGIEKLPNTDLNVSEGQDTISIGVSLSSRSFDDVNVLFEVVPGSGAIEGVDYQLPFPENRLTPEGNSSTITVPKKELKIVFFLNVYTDLIDEIPETITFRLLPSDKVGVQTNALAEFTITITDAVIGDVVLPDTGVDTCYGTDDVIACNDNEFPNQDADIKTAEPQFLKYEFIQSLSTTISKPLPDDAPSWECVYDKNTKLIWAIGMKFRPNNNLEPVTQFNWFNNNSTINGGYEGLTVETDKDSTVVAKAERNTEEFEALINDPGPTAFSNDSLCQVRNWRLAKMSELLSIMDFDTIGDTYLDQNYFPIEYFPVTYYWTSTPSPINSKDAWCLFLGKTIKDAAKSCDKTSEQPAVFVSSFEVTTP